MQKILQKRNVESTQLLLTLCERSRNKKIYQKAPHKPTVQTLLAMMLGSILSLLVSIFNEFVMKTGHPFYIISNSIIVLLALIMAILKKNGKQELALHLALPYFLISGICSSLVYYDQLPTILS